MTAFITRPGASGPELLLFEHPHAGIQIPAGSVARGEAPEAAARREAEEETGLVDLALRAYLGAADDLLPEAQALLRETTPVYVRPRLDAWPCGEVRLGMQVRVERQAPGFVQVTYLEYDRVPDPEYVSAQVTGWVPAAAITRQRRRHFYHFNLPGPAPDRWTHAADTDFHHFTLFWAPLAALPAIIPPQDRWLAFLLNE